MMKAPANALERLQHHTWLFLDECAHAPPVNPPPLPPPACARSARSLRHPAAPAARPRRPGSSLGARLWSTFMMLTILLSIASFTLASVPTNTRWVDVWANRTTGEPVLGSSARDAGFSLTDYFYYGSPRLTSDELADGASPFMEIETFCIASFTFEYLGRLLASPRGPGPKAYLLNLANTVDFVSIMPYYVELAIPSGGDMQVLAVLRLIRLTRITRILKLGKLGKNSKSLEGLVVLLTTLRSSMGALFLLIVMLGMVAVLFATMMFTFEGGTYDAHRCQYVREDGSASPFESIPASMWWAIITMSTVGYGDQYPISTSGKARTRPPTASPDVSTTRCRRAARRAVVGGA